MFTTLIDIITLFQLWLLALTLFFTKKGRPLSNKVLACFLIIQSQCVIAALQWRYFDWSVEYLPHIFFVPVSFLYILGAGLYFYTRTMTEPEFKFKKWDWLHTLPLILHLGIFLFRFHHFDTLAKQELLRTNTFFSSIEWRIIDNTFFFLLFAYEVAIIIRLIKYQKQIRQVASNNKSGLQWLIFIILGFITLWVSDVLEYYLFWILGHHTWLVHIPHPAVFILTTAMVWKTMMQSNTFEELSLIENASQYQIADKLVETYIQKLNQVMEEKKPHLQPELTLSKLSEMTGITPRHLSLVLNEHFNQNFYEFINHHRIQASKELLQDEEKAKWTILEILYEAGFNSKTTFNIAFKKQTGMTPKIYRQQVQNK